MKKGVWRENDKDIKQEKDELEKVRDIPMPHNKSKETTRQNKQ